MKKLHLTINNFPTTSISTSQWPIHGEPERIAVKFGNKEYVTVLDNPPYFEVWSLDENDGQLLALEERIIPNPIPIKVMFEDKKEDQDFLKFIEDSLKSLNK